MNYKSPIGTDTNPIAGIGQRLGNLWGAISPGLNTIGTALSTGASEAGKVLGGVLGSESPLGRSLSPDPAMTPPDKVLGGYSNPQYKGTSFYQPPPAPSSPTNTLGVKTANAQTTDTQPSVGLARPNAQPGDPWYMVPQGVSPELSNFLDSYNTPKPPPNPADPMAGMAASTSGQPYTGYNVNVPHQTNSDVLGSGLTYADVLSSRNQLMQDYQAAQKKYADDYQNITGQEIKGQFAGNTEAYGTGMANLVRMQGTPVLTADQMRSQNALGALGANATTAGLVNPFNNQVAPGSTAVNPVTGQPSFSGMGASPSTISSTAQELYSRDLSLGQPSLTPDGQINWQHYTTQAQQIYSSMGGGSGMGGSYAEGGSNGPTQSPYNTGAGSAGGSFGNQGYGNVSNLPPALQKYVITGQISGQPASFVLASRVPPAMQASAQTAAAAAGIPYLDQDGANSLYAAEQILGIVDAAKALSVRNLNPGVSGRITDTLKNWANNYLQFNPDLSNFAQLKDAASKATTALAGGVGSGFRMNMGIIEAATQNLPTANDNIETALTKADALGTQIINGLKPVFPQINQNGQYGGLLKSQYGGGSAPSNSSSQYSW